MASVALFVGAFSVFSTPTPGFDVIHDYISELGARGQPFATWWNVCGFLLVGLVFCAFGWCLGQVIGDRVVGICLTVSGIAFAPGAIPTDLADARASLSKAHFASICIALAAWCSALARIGRPGRPDPLGQVAAAIAAALVVLPVVGVAAGCCAEPIAHRVVLASVFGWVLFTSLRLLSASNLPAWRPGQPG